MITDYIVDNFDTMIKLAVGAFIAFLIAIGFISFVVICYVLYEDWKGAKKNDRQKDSDRGSLS